MEPDNSNPTDDDRALAEDDAENEKFLAAGQAAVRKALLMHKRLGNPIATWKDGKVVIVPPEEIDIDGD